MIVGFFTPLIRNYYDTFINKLHILIKAEWMYGDFSLWLMIFLKE